MAILSSYPLWVVTWKYFRHFLFLFDIVVMPNEIMAPLTSSKSNNSLSDGLFVHTAQAITLAKLPKLKKGRGALTI